jgi:sugar lactone lactonase YvrE
MPFRVAFASFFLLLVSVVLLTAFRPPSIKRPENGDGGPATSAPINGPTAISIDQNGNVYVVELVGRTVRKIVAKTGLIETIAGNGKDCCFEEGKGAASTALFAPIQVAVDRNGDVYVADTSSHIRLVHATTGIATTVISELEGMDADKPGVAPSLPKYEHVDGLAFDSLGTLYIAGSAHGKIYTVSHGVISEFAGFGGHGYTGDGKTAREAQFNFPMGIAFGPTGDLLIADYENCRIRKVDKASNMAGWRTLPHASTVQGGPSFALFAKGGQSMLSPRNAYH